MPAKKKTYYPPRHHNIVSAQMKFAVKLVGGLAIVTCITFAGSFYSDTLLAPSALALAILLLAIWSNAIGLYDAVHHVHIVPYFERRVGDIDSYCSGYELAKQCTKLDEIATASGNASLSSFGFNDDMSGEELTWHDASEGLRTVKSLLQTVKTENHDVEQQVALEEDLERLKQAIERAVNQEIRFCLLLLHGGSTSGHEWSLRKGSAF